MAVNLACIIYCCLADGSSAHLNKGTGKRKAGSEFGWMDVGRGKKSKHPPYFIPQLAHIVAMCDERLPFALLCHEVNTKLK